MLLIELKFPAGRYHATPWGRNVNEGAVEWPPSPFRLGRALVDCWKRRLPYLAEERVRKALAVLGGDLQFRLPPATVAHTRSYLHANNPKKPFDKQLIFDAFVVIDRSEVLTIGIPGEFSASVVEDMNLLLNGLSYLGRSESWVKARAYQGSDPSGWNCRPACGDVEGEEVMVSCLLGEDAYAILPGPPRVKDKSRKKDVGREMSWTQALCLSSSDLLDDGWSSHPVLRPVIYVRPPDALKPRRPLSRHSGPVYRCVTYALHSAVLPRVQATLPFADRARRLLMGIHRKIQGDDPAAISQVFSGKTPESVPLTGHSHAFFVPLDLDGDNRIDHLRILVAEPFTPDELLALDAFRKIFGKGGHDIHLHMTGVRPFPPKERCRRFRSATPFLTARHWRKGRGSYGEWLLEEVARECVHHGLPRPTEARTVEACGLGKRPVRCWEFARSRKDEVPLHGYAFELTFAEPVEGPFLLGTACHFGLGLFVPTIGDGANPE